MPQALDIDLLRTFHSVARLGRFKNAAAHLGKSTSAVSVHIQRLEELVGTRLFERDNQGVILSPRGERFLSESTALMVEHDRLLAAIGGPVLSGKLRFGIPEEYAGGFLKRYLPLFTLGNPGIELEIEAASSETLMSLFSKRHLDAAISVVPVGFATSGKRLAKIDPVWAVSKDLQPLSLPVLPVAMPAAGCIYRKMAEDGLTEAGLEWRPILTSGNSAAIAATVASGMAVAIFDGRRLPEGLTTVPDDSGLPALAGCEAVFHTRGASDAEMRLAETVKTYFQFPGQ